MLACKGAKVPSCFYPGGLVTRTGEWEICSVSRRLPDYLGELAYMHSEVKDFFRTQMLLLWQLLIEMFHLFFEPTRSTFRFFLGLGFSFYMVNFLCFRGNRKICA